VNGKKKRESLPVAERKTRKEKTKFRQAAPTTGRPAKRQRKGYGGNQGKKKGKESPAAIKNGNQAGPAPRVTKKEGKWRWGKKLGLILKARLNKHAWRPKRGVRRDRELRGGKENREKEGLIARYENANSQKARRLFKRK